MLGLPQRVHQRDLPVSCWLLLLAACAPDGLAPLEQRIIDLSDAAFVPAAEGEGLWGTTLTTGCDLDHDGRAEWAVNAPNTDSTYGPGTVVRVFEGLDVLTERHPTDDHIARYGNVMATGDVDGDGFADLLFSTATTFSDGRVQALVDTEPEHDTRHQLGEDRSKHVRSLSAQPSGGVFSVWTGPGVRVLHSALSTAPRPEPHPLDEGDDILDLTWEDLTEADVHAYVVGGAPLADGYPSLWLAGYVESIEADGIVETGSPLLCPLEPLSDLSPCEAVGELHQERGDANVMLDVDDDGTPEIATTNSVTPGLDGSVTILDLNGTVRATIRGTGGAQFGTRMSTTTAPDGSRWLVVSQYNYRGTRPGQLYAFRHDQLDGDLTDMDAARIYTDDIQGSPLATSIAFYQPTPQEPLMLLIGDAFHEKVYYLRFEL